MAANLWFTDCSIAPNPHPESLFPCQEQPLGSGSCSQGSRACSRKSFLADFWHPLAIISHSPVHSQTVRCVFPSAVISARSGCSWGHRTHPDPLSSRSQAGVCLCPISPPVRSGWFTLHRKQWPTASSSPPMSAQSTDTGLASSDSTCQQDLMSLFSHTSPLKKKKKQPDLDTSNTCTDSCMSTLPHLHTDPLGFYCPSYLYQSNAGIGEMLSHTLICCSDQGFKRNVCQSLFMALEAVKTTCICYLFTNSSCHYALIRHWQQNKTVRVFIWRLSQTNSKTISN